MTFDASTPDLFAPLQVGGCVVLAGPDGQRDPDYLAELIRAQKRSLTWRRCRRY
ncbi:hypothetical protein SIM91_02160 [Rhodococcus opacus]|nr:hypothetical protein [Rhodococcus opacus]